MEQQIADLLRQNQDLIRALQIRDDSHSHKVTVQFDKFDEENENFDSFIERFETYLDVQNVPIANRAKVFVSSLSAKLYQLLKNLLAPDIPSDQTKSRHSSEWATPVVPVVKSDGSIRLCADYSVTLNPNLIVPQHPLPRLDEIFGSLNGGKQFSKLDFKHAYLQMKVHPDSQKLMTINTHKGLYICKRLMYGLNGAPAIWQRYVDGLFQGVTTGDESKDIELGPLLRALREGKDLQGREAQYTIEDGCIMYGQRVCIPRKFRKNVLEELHAGHLGIVKMKAIARSFVYWKNIDNDIEEASKNCVDCARYKADPPKSKVHYWEYPSMPWERIHVDFAGPIFEHTFFLIVDAHSKWLEVYPMKVTTTKKTIECLRDSFERFGLPRVLVSDNGSQFTSYEFQRFMHKNGVRHKTSAPFKPSSN
ncbi:uncharacterized protein K02A2.6 [Trichonephila clavipes]|nr:uncharacterized protein K02A2.6 [Trichonephila clavipes]